MRNRFIGRGVFLLMLPLLWLPPAALGQRQSLTFTDGSGTTHAGSFQVEYVQIQDGDQTNLSGGSTLNSTFSNIGNGSIEVKLGKLSWDNPGFSGKVIILIGDINPGENLVLEPQRKKITLSPGDKSPKLIKYRPINEGAYTVAIAFRVQATDASGVSDPIGTIRKSIKVSFGEVSETPPPPETPAATPTPEETVATPEEQAEPSDEEESFWEKMVEIGINEEKSTKQRINSFERYLKEYPSGTYREVALNQIKDLERESENEEPQVSPPPAATQRPATSQDPEDVLYASIDRFRRVKDCETYLREYGREGTYGISVQQILNEVSPIKVLSNGHPPNSAKDIFEIKLAFAQEPVSYQITGGQGEVRYWDDRWSGRDSSLFVSVGPSQLLTVRFTDGRGKRVSAELDSRFEPLDVLEFEVTLNEDERKSAASFQFQISGGDPPYFAQFVRMGEADATYELPLGSSEKIRTVPMEDVLASMGDSAKLNGPYYLRFVDKRKTESRFMNKPQYVVRVYQAEKPTPWGTLIGVLVAIVLVILGIRTISQRQAEARKAKIDQRRKEKNMPVAPPAQERATQAFPTPERPPVVKPSVSAAPPPRKKVEEPEKPISPPPSKIKGNVRITRKMASNERNTAIRPFTATADSPEYQRMDLADHWPDPAVSEVYLHRDVVSSLDQFIHDENVDSFREDQNDLIPEIGGFLMGIYRLDPASGQYQVSIEKFQPITAEAQDLYKVEFGVTAWAELANVQDMYADLRTIGWFHTHPGHGLFLSQPDLRIQEGFFKDNFQLAMEIDTKSATLDMALFVRDKTGTIYNSRDRISPSWFYWMDIRNQHRSDPS